MDGKVIQMYNYGEFIRGFTEYVILSILEEQDSYGYQLRKLIYTRSNNTFNLTEATLYLSLKRLTKDQLIEPYECIVSDSGVKRIYYRITPEGVKFLHKFRQDAPKILDYINLLIIGEKNEKEDQKTYNQKGQSQSL